MSSSLRQRWSSLAPVGKLAAVASILAVLIFVFTLYPILLALFIPAAKSSVSKSENDDRAKQAYLAFADYEKQYNGRSIFFTPAPLVSKEPDLAPVATDEHKDPPKPSSYGGPPIIAMINDAVWFDNGKHLKVGDPAKDDMRVVKINPPWEATIEWKGVEFSVNLFTRDSLVLKTAKSKDAPADSSSTDASSSAPPATDVAAKPESKPESKPDVKPETKPEPPPASKPDTPQNPPPADPNSPPLPPPGQTPPPPPPPENPQTQPEATPSETPKDHAR